MKKIIGFLLVLVLIAVGVLFLVNGSSKYESDKYSLVVTPNDKDFSIRSNIAFTLPDQFGNSYSLGSDITRLIFAFTKDTGHIVKSYMMDKPEGFLASKNAVIVADISGMPVVIQNTFALPDLKKSNYKMMLIYDKDMAAKIKNGKDATKVIIVDLVKNVVKSINFAGSTEELDKYLK